MTRSWLEARAGRGRRRPAGRARRSSARSGAVRRGADRARPRSHRPPRCRGAPAEPVAEQTMPLASSRPEPASQPTAGTAPMPDHDHLGGQQLTVGQRDAGDPVLADQVEDPGAGDQPDAVAGVQTADDGSELGTERQDQWGGRRLDDGDVEAQPVGGRGDLGADEAGADDDEPGAGDEFGPERARIVERAEGVHTGRGPSRAYAPRHRSRGRSRRLGADDRRRGSGSGWRRRAQWPVGPAPTRRPDPRRASPGSGRPRSATRPGTPWTAEDGRTGGAARHRSG